MTAAEGGGIFISYRRQETSHLAGRLYDRLADRFGEGQVFIDVDTIEPGVDFAEEIFRAVAACKVLLAIIGPTWLTAADERGCRRLDDPDDIVRLEVEAALARAVRVIPILVEGAVMPVREDLPESLAALARRNALPIRHESFRADAGRLVTAIERVLAAPGTAVASADPGTRLGDDAAATSLKKAPNLPSPMFLGLSGFWPTPNASPTPSPRVLEGIGAARHRGGAGSHRPRPRRPAPSRRRTHRQLHHQRALEGIGAARHRGGAGSHRPRPRRPAPMTPNASPTPSPTSPRRHRR